MKCVYFLIVPSSQTHESEKPRLSKKIAKTILLILAYRFSNLKLLYLRLHVKNETSPEFKEFNKFLKYHAPIILLGLHLKSQTYVNFLPIRLCYVFFDKENNKV